MYGAIQVQATPALSANCPTAIQLPSLFSRTGVSESLIRESLIFHLEDYSNLIESTREIKIDHTSNKFV